MIDLIDALRELLEPESEEAGVSVNGVRLDNTAAMPFDFEPNTLYVVEEQDLRTLDETWTPEGGVERQSFIVNALYVIDSEGENAITRRSRAVSIALDEKRNEYCRLVRMTRTNGDVWHHIQASADADFVRQLQVRGIAVRITGYRFVS